MCWLVNCISDKIQLLSDGDDAEEEVLADMVDENDIRRITETATSK